MRITVSKKHDEANLSNSCWLFIVVLDPHANPDNQSDQHQSTLQLGNQLQNNQSQTKSHEKYSYTHTHLFPYTHSFSKTQFTSLTQNIKTGPCMCSYGVIQLTFCYLFLNYFSIRHDRFYNCDILAFF